MITREVYKNTMDLNFWDKNYLREVWCSGQSKNIWTAESDQKQLSITVLLDKILNFRLSLSTLKILKIIDLKSLEIEGKF